MSYLVNIQEPFDAAKAADYFAAQEFGRQEIIKHENIYPMLGLPVPDPKATLVWCLLHHITDVEDFFFQHHLDR